MANVLVTGATGFIGANLSTRLAERGDTVTCLVREGSKLDKLLPLGVRFARGDVRDAESVRRAVAGSGVVYHLAGLVTAFRQADLIKVNVEGFRNVVSACAQQPTPPTLVSVSSLAAVGPSTDRPLTEDDPARPVSNYGRAKRAAEVIAIEYADRVPITIIRPPIVFGEGDLNLRDMFRSIFRFGIHLALGVARRRYSFIHVRDLIDSMILSAEKGSRLEVGSGGARIVPGRGVYFVATDEQPTYAELGGLIGDCLGRRQVRVWRSNGATLLVAAAAIAEAGARVRGTPYILNFDKAREALAGNWTCSAQSIRRELGFVPQAPLVDRLQQTSNWYVEHNLL